MDAEENRYNLTRVDDVGAQDPAWRNELSTAVSDAEHASATLRRAAGELPSPESEAWKRFAADVASATLRFDVQLGTAAARLRAEQDHPDSDHHETHETQDGPLDPLGSIRHRVSDVFEDLSHLVTHRSGDH